MSHQPLGTADVRAGADIRRAGRAASPIGAAKPGGAILPAPGPGISGNMAHSGAAPSCACGLHYKPSCIASRITSRLNNLLPSCGFAQGAWRKLHIKLGFELQSIFTELHAPIGKLQCTSHNAMAAKARIYIHTKLLANSNNTSFRSSSQSSC